MGPHSSDVLLDCIHLVRGQSVPNWGIPGRSLDHVVGHHDFKWRMSAAMFTVQFLVSSMSILHFALPLSRNLLHTQAKWQYIFSLFLACSDFIFQCCRSRGLVHLTLSTYPSGFPGCSPKTPNVFCSLMNGPRGVIMVDVMITSKELEFRFFIPYDLDNARRMYLRLPLSSLLIRLLHQTSIRCPEIRDRRDGI